MFTGVWTGLVGLAVIQSDVLHPAFGVVGLVLAPPVPYWLDGVRRPQRERRSSVGWLVGPDRGDLPAVKIGGRGVWRVDRKRLDEYIDRLHEETERWARDHPLNPPPDDGDG
jgi:hypothetical protein